MKNLMKDYGKYILAVLGVFLMLTFTLPSFMKSMQDNGNAEVGRLNGKKITYADVTQSSREMQILGRFRLLPALQTVIPEDNDVDRGTHWMLLLREASQAGIVASEGEIRQAYASSNLSDADLQALLGDAGLSQQDLRVCIAHGLMILKGASVAASGAEVAVPEIEFRANEELSTVRMQYAIVDGAKDWNKQPAPTDAQLKKQYDLYKEIIATPASSETPPPVVDGHTYPFGYKYPDRVQVEYLKFDRSTLLSRFQPTREDYQDAYKYYSSHLSDFHKKSASSMTVGTQQPFEDVRDKLVKDQVAARVDKFLKRITDRVLETAKQPWNNAKPDDGGYRETVPHDKWLDYKALAQDLKQGKEFDGYAPEYVQVGAWQGHDELAATPGIGSAFYETPTGRYSFADVATHLRELELPRDNFPRLFLQVGIESPVLQDAAGNMYIFRVTDAQKSHVPASIDEVRTQVVQDLQKVAAYEKAQAQAKSLADATTGGDLSTIAKKQSLDTRTVPEITHVGDDYPDVRGVPKLVDAAFDLARQQKSAGTQPAAATQRGAIKAVPLNVDARLQIFVVALDAFNPATPTAFAANREKYLSDAQQFYERVMLLSWVRLDAVAKRLNYVPKSPFASPKTAA